MKLGFRLGSVRVWAWEGRTGLLTIVLHTFEAHLLEVRCPSFIKDLGWRRLTWEIKRQCVKNASPDLRASVRDAAKEDVDR